MGSELAHVGRLLAVPARAAMLDVLLDGLPRSASELATAARVRPPTASAHLAELVDGGLVTVRPAGRHRYYELAGPHVASVLESISTLGPPPAPPHSLRQSRDRTALRQARTCYDHLAGRLGVGLHDALSAQRWLTDGSAEVTAAGVRHFADLGIDVAELRDGRRRLAFGCLDWTERRTHLAGALGAALASTFLDHGWVRRRPNGGRGLTITPAGADELRSRFDLDVAAWQRAAS